MPPSRGEALPPLLVLSALSIYGLYLSYANIVRLRKYEEQSEKVAEWSSMVAERLKKTRSTQTSGTMALLVSSLTSALVLVFLPTISSHLLLAGCLANVAALYLSYTHMASFWNDSVQTRIPLAEDFNKAIRGSERVVRVLVTLAFGWALAGGLFVAIERAWMASAAGSVVWTAVVGLCAWYML